MHMFLFFETIYFVPGITPGISIDYLFVCLSIFNNISMIQFDPSVWLTKSAKFLFGYFSDVVFIKNRLVKPDAYV